jgi:hypothetical protein
MRVSMREFGDLYRLSDLVWDEAMETAPMEGK